MHKMGKKNCNEIFKLWPVPIERKYACKTSESRPQNHRVKWSTIWKLTFWNHRCPENRHQTKISGRRRHEEESKRRNKSSSSVAYGCFVTLLARRKQCVLSRMIALTDNKTILLLFHVYMDWVRDLSCWTSLLFIQIWAVFQGAVQPGCEAGHSPPSSVVVNNACSHTSTLPYVRMAKC